MSLIGEACTLKRVTSGYTGFCCWVAFDAEDCEVSRVYDDFTSGEWERFCARHSYAIARLPRPLREELARCRAMAAMKEMTC